jgi:hypothetical protein
MRWSIAKCLNMLPLEQLFHALQTVPLIQFEGWAYRIVAEEYREAPIEIIGSFLAGGRFNISQRFGMLYTADSRGDSTDRSAALLRNQPSTKRGASKPGINSFAEV